MDARITAIKERFAKEPNPWEPMSSPVDIKHLGKLGEEASELANAIFRCLIQGTEKQDRDGKPNLQWLEEEIADVLINADLVIERFKLSSEYIKARMEAKRPFLKKWHYMEPSK